MDSHRIRSEIDREIARLREARNLLAGSALAPPSSSGNKAKKKRALSPEARARIVSGQKKRWAAQRKASK